MSLWDPKSMHEAADAVNTISSRMMMANSAEAAKIKRKITGAIGNMKKKAKNASSKRKKDEYKQIAHMFKRMKKRLR